MFSVYFPRHFSWVRQKPLNTGFTGCLHSMLMQSKTQSLASGSIFNVPPLLTLKNWNLEQNHNLNWTLRIDLRNF